MKTVSRVLNNEPNVATKTRQRVLAVAKTLRYSPNLAARGLASSKSYLIALIYDNSPSPNYIASVQGGAINACRENGFHLVVEPLDLSGTKASGEVERLLERLPVDGIILTSPLCDNPEILQILKRLSIPYVPITPTVPNPDMCSVKMDNISAAQEMTEYLIGQGHKKIGIITGHKDHISSELRYKGFTLAMEKAGLAINPDWVVEGDFSFRSGVKAAEIMLGSKEHPTAIFACNDDMAAGVLSVTNSKGISVPGKLSVGGFDDTPLATVITPQLTTIRQPIHQMGYRAASLLINPPQPEDALDVYMLDHKLIIRESTAKSRDFDN